MGVFKDGKVDRRLNFQVSKAAPFNNEKYIFLACLRMRLIDSPLQILDVNNSLFKIDKYASSNS